METPDADDPPPLYQPREPEVNSSLDDDSNVEELPPRTTEPPVQFQHVNLQPYDINTVGRDGPLATKFLEVLADDGEYQVVRLTFLEGSNGLLVRRL
jgi:hypothetical protein